MTTFDEREAAAESRFAHEEARRFAAQARATHRLGTWFAESLGQSAADADVFAQGLVSRRVGGMGDAAMMAYLVEQSVAAGVPLDGEVIRQRMDVFGSEALQDGPPA